MFDGPTSPTTLAIVVAATAATAAIALTMLYPSAFLRWLQRKRYQYEVTFSLYMLTPTEKFIFSAFDPCNRSAIALHPLPLPLCNSSSHPTSNSSAPFN